MQMFMAIRSVASETAKLAVALGAILIPLFLLAVALEHIRGGTAAPVDSVVSLLKGVWF